ncbi:unnamed protein product [Nesidiocoris tenuis]|uniref:Uncharacterized protein n=1 Tax=Nesidiocoris tenuis TaxID=355587 RepID=A0A6H5GGL2_9HEMI|nr:unnamed protein product [Nesidiocoris tenuis]
MFVKRAYRLAECSNGQSLLNCEQFDPIRKPRGGIIKPIVNFVFFWNSTNFVFYPNCAGGSKIARSKSVPAVRRKREVNPCRLVRRAHQHGRRAALQPPGLTQHSGGANPRHLRARSFMFILCRFMFDKSLPAPAVQRVQSSAVFPPGRLCRVASGFFAYQG